jgi:hopanoid biosynthesis associated protein HpnK
MVAAPAAADAVARARRLPRLGVGLHLVLVDGMPAASPRDIPALLGRDGCFSDREVAAGIRFFFRPGLRRQLAAEIRAQFEAFRATGLRLDHVNGHKHIHLHPTVARLAVTIGRDYGMRAMRLPAEPAAILRAAFPAEPYRAPFYDFAVRALRRRMSRAGLAASDQVFGIAWSGAMDAARLLGLLPVLPGGVSEIYSHPRNVPGDAELAALLSPELRARVAELGISLVSYSDL